MQTDMEDKRKHFRVDAKIPIGSRLLSPQEAASGRSKIGGKTASSRDLPSPPLTGDPRLNEWLRMLNEKLDSLLAQQSGKSDVAVELKIRPVNISAGGILFPSDTACKVGDAIEIHMEFPMKKTLSLVVIGQVIRVNPPLVSATFIQMDAEIQQKISDYVFYREREIIASERM